MVVDPSGATPPTVAPPWPKETPGFALRRRHAGLDQEIDDRHAGLENGAGEPNRGDLVDERLERGLGRVVGAAEHDRRRFLGGGHCGGAVDELGHLSGQTRCASRRSGAASVRRHDVAHFVDGQQRQLQQEALDVAVIDVDPVLKEAVGDSPMRAEPDRSRSRSCRTSSRRPAS